MRRVARQAGQVATKPVPAGMAAPRAHSSPCAPAPWDASRRRRPARRAGKNANVAKVANFDGAGRAVVPQGVPQGAPRRPVERDVNDGVDDRAHVGAARPPPGPGQGSGGVSTAHWASVRTEG